MELMLVKGPDGALHAPDEHTAEQLRRVKVGRLVRVEAKEVRNPMFHRKFMALLRVGFDAFEPAVKEHRGFPVQKEFEQFRSDVIVAAGYYIVTTTLGGHIRVRAKSIRFGRMKQETFEKLYSAVADVLLQKVLVTYSRRDLDNVVNRILGFV